MTTSSNIAPLLHHLAFVLGRQADQTLLEQLGIGLSQYKILAMVEQNPHIQQRDIAASLGQTEASVSRQAKLLSEKGLLAVKVNPKNRRQHLSVLTIKGKRLTDAALEIYNRLHSDALQALGAKEQERLYESLAAIHHQTCQAGKTAACDPLTQIWLK